MKRNQWFCKRSVGFFYPLALIYRLPRSGPVFSLSENWRRLLQLESLLKKQKRSVLLCVALCLAVKRFLVAARPRWELCRSKSAIKRVSHMVSFRKNLFQRWSECPAPKKDSS
jgi:hypothetical protein